MLLDKLIHLKSSSFSQVRFLASYPSINSCFTAEKQIEDLIMITQIADTKKNDHLHTYGLCIWSIIWTTAQFTITRPVSPRWGTFFMVSQNDLLCVFYCLSPMCSFFVKLVWVTAYELSEWSSMNASYATTNRAWRSRIKSWNFIILPILLQILWIHRLLLFALPAAAARSRLKSRTA